MPEEGETSGETAGEATEATAGAASGATAEAAAKVAKGKRVHHKTSCCRVPGWSFKGQDLIRHLRRVHLKRGDIREEDLAEMSKIKNQGNKARHPRSQGQLKKWCPVKGCSSLVSYLTKHLRRAHNLKKDSAKLANMVKEAKPYKGFSELEHVGDSSSDEEAAVIDAPKTLTLKKQEKTKPAATNPNPQQEEEEEEEEPEEPNSDDISDHDKVTKPESETNKTTVKKTPNQTITHQMTLPQGQSPRNSKNSQTRRSSLMQHRSRTTAINGSADSSSTYRYQTPVTRRQSWNKICKLSFLKKKKKKRNVTAKKRKRKIAS